VPAPLEINARSGIYGNAAVTLADIIGNLRRYDEPSIGQRSITIFAAEPWTPASEASVEWPSEGGGVPFHRKPILLRLTDVKVALKFFGTEYELRVMKGDMEAMCQDLVQHVVTLNSEGMSHDAEIVPPDPASECGEFTREVDADLIKLGPHALRLRSIKGFTLLFHGLGAVDYSDTETTVRVGIERCLKPARFAVYAKSNGLRTVTSSKAEEILNNVARGLRHLGHTTQIARW
jgi:hypothetical protein